MKFNDKVELTKIQSAIRNQDKESGLKAMKSLVNSNNVNKKYDLIDSYTPLLDAVEQDRLEIVIYLLVIGADINSVLSTRGRKLSALQLAAIDNFTMKATLIVAKLYKNTDYFTNNPESLVPFFDIYRDIFGQLL